MKETSGFRIKRPIVDQYSFQVVGQIEAVFTESTVLDPLAESMISSGIDAYIFENTSQVMFSTHHNVKNSEYESLIKSFKQQSTIPKEIRKKYYISKRKNSKDFSYVLMANRKVLWLKNLKMFSLIVLMGALLSGTLLFILNRIFNRYFVQVEKIVDTTARVAEGNLKERIDVTEVQVELLELSNAINFMVQSLEQYIKENYELEIKQRDAHMRALQSQINPHFLYNTLEYIRMYALSKQQKELAEVVFAFSALLRNNTTQEKTTKLQKELSFCEKYVYLYQMRYPDRVAYRFDIDEKLAEMEIPKFSLQPLIENYFVHGIDYSRQNNAISVKAFFEEEDVVILITDNGKGIEELKLLDLQHTLQQKDNLDSTSIGIANVYERLSHFYKKKFSMDIFSVVNEGTVITIRIKGGRQFAL